MNPVKLAAPISGLLREGAVIPAHPLALDERRRLDERHQKALTRYYLDAGAGGVAVGVHTTQFAIRKPGAGLYAPVLEIVAEEIAARKQNEPVIKVAGIVGSTAQAVAEAQTAARLGYDLGLVSLGGLDDWSDERLLAHIREIVQVIPVFGFYLQPAAGGRLLAYSFWRQFADIEGVAAIKIATFNRYQTLAVVRAVCESERADQIALYTGNDDNILPDLVTTYAFSVRGRRVEKHMAGGLLGQFAVGTRQAVLWHREIQRWRRSGEAGTVPGAWLTKGIELTDYNAAIFDAEHAFRGCIPGIHEVLHRQGLLGSVHCLDPAECLSPGQAAEIARVHAAYPHLHDDEFIRMHLDEWLS